MKLIWMVKFFFMENMFTQNDLINKFFKHKRFNSLIYVSISRIFSHDNELETYHRRRILNYLSKQELHLLSVHLGWSFLRVLPVSVWVQPCLYVVVKWSVEGLLKLTESPDTSKAIFQINRPKSYNGVGPICLFLRTSYYRPKC